MICFQLISLLCFQDCNQVYIFWYNPVSFKNDLKPFLGEWCSAFRKSRKEQVTFTRLRIGLSRLTHTFILKQEQQAQCLTCQTPCTIKHVFFECKVFNDTRKHYFLANTMKDLFENVPTRELKFLIGWVLWHINPFCLLNARFC